MGTNFYLPQNCPNPCAHCASEPLHIGKRSAGWTFGFRAYPDAGLTSWRAWRDKIRTSPLPVKDEYGCNLTADEFEALVLVTREPWGTGKVAPRVRVETDERATQDAEGWDFWAGEFC